jgi:hypothetical protein
MSKTNCVNIDTNEENCPCTSLDCDRHGVCCECLRAHSDRDGLPACLRVKIQDSQLFRENITKLISQTTE